MSVKPILSAVQSISAISQFASGGELIVVLDTIGGVHMRAAADVLRHLNHARDQRSELRSVVTHLQAAEAAFESGWRRLDNVLGRASGWAPLWDMYVSHLNSLMLLSVVYLALGEVERATDYLTKLGSIKGKYFGPTDHNFDDKSVDSSVHFVEHVKEFSRIALMALSIANPSTYASLMKGDPELINVEEFITDAKQRCAELQVI
jgi:hypothetical protein